MYKKLLFTIILMLTCVFPLAGCRASMAMEEEELSDESESSGGDFGADGDETAIGDAGEAAGEAVSGDAAAEIYVYVCGAVNEPGVYKLASGARLYEALEKAGGLAEDAYGTWLNQAEALTDGQKIEVPTKKEAAKLAKASAQTGGDGSGTGGSGEGGSADSSGKVNLNTATREELMTLSGIGESKANAIIEYREQNGNFKSIEDIKNVSGIGDATFRNLESSITV